MRLVSKKKEKKNNQPVPLSQNLTPTHPQHLREAGGPATLPASTGLRGPLGEGKETGREEGRLSLIHI